MSATRPATKTELKDYALRRLGYPTIDINVATEQLDDLIEEAIDYYQEYHYNGSYKSFMRIEVTDAIKTAAQTYDQSGSTAWYEAKNYVDSPPGMLGINHVEFGPRGIKNEWVLFDETMIWKQILMQTG